VTCLFCESDGTFPNHHPDPTVPENLEDLVREVRRSGAELGIAFDGDGDRIGAVDENGRIVFGDQLLVILGRDAVRRFGPGVPVIFDVKCSEVLPRALRDAGARPEMWKTGHSLIKARMKELGAPLAGVYLVPGLARLLADLPETFATPEIRVDCTDEAKFGIVEDAARHFAARYEVNTIDGVRIAYPHGWALLRASNTQPVLVMRFEATTPAALAAYQGEMRAWLAERGISA
jgi:phosphomannomutase / phosphoglucomutase